MGLAIRFGFRVSATVGGGAEGFRTAALFDGVTGFRCAGSSTVVVSITSIVIVVVVSQQWLRHFGNQYLTIGLGYLLKKRTKVRG